MKQTLKKISKVIACILITITFPIWIIFYGGFVLAIRAYNRVWESLDF